MTIREFLDLTPKDISKMDVDERRSIVDEISEKANKRLERLSKLNLPSPAFTNRAVYKDDYIVVEDGQFKYKPFQSTGKNGNQLANEIKLMRLFLEAQTSTITGAKLHISRLYKKLFGKEEAKDALKSLSYDETKTFWNAYSKVLQRNAGIITQKGGVTPGYITSDQVQQMIYKTMKANPQMTPEDIEAASRPFMKNLYEENVGKPRKGREYKTGKSRKRRKS